jgi:tRNA-binding protein
MAASVETDSTRIFVRKRDPLGLLAHPIAVNPLAPHDIRVATILAASPLNGARKPAYRLRLDFGELGERQSSAQLTLRYQPEALVGKQVLAVVSLPPKRIAGFLSECLVLGVDGSDGGVVLIRPEAPVPNGAAVY